MFTSTHSKRSQCSPIATRSTKGSVLVLTLFSGGLLCTAAMLALSIVLLLLQNSSLQSQTDALVLDNGTLLNANDRTSQINNLIAKSRELVFNSRQSLNACTDEHANLRPFADRLMALSRTQALRVLLEKKRLVQSTVNELLAKDYGSTAAMTVSLEDQKPFARDLTVGYLIDQVSDVPAPIGNPALLSFDTTAGYIQSDSSLYKAFTDLKLPGPDDDLQFSLASIPTANNVRLLNGLNFHPLAQLVKGGAETNEPCLEFPSRVRLTMTSPVTIFGALKTTATTTATATTHSTEADL